MICVSNILYVYIPCNMRVVRCEVCNVRCACVICVQCGVYVNVMCEICAICATWCIYVWCVYVSNVMWGVYACCNIFEMISVNARYDVYVWCSVMWACNEMGCVSMRGVMWYDVRLIWCDILDMVLYICVIWCDVMCMRDVSVYVSY